MERMTNINHFTTIMDHSMLRNNKKTTTIYESNLQKMVTNESDSIFGLGKQCALKK